MKTLLLLFLVLIVDQNVLLGQETETSVWFSQRLDSLHQQREEMSIRMQQLDKEIEQLTREWHKYQNYANRQAIQEDYNLAREKAMSVANKLNYAFLIDHAQLRGSLETMKSGLKARVYILDAKNVDSMSFKVLHQVEDSQGQVNAVDTAEVEINMEFYNQKQTTEFEWENLWEYQKNARAEVFEASVFYKDGRELLIRDLTCHWIWRHLDELECE